MFWSVTLDKSQTRSQLRESAYIWHRPRSTLLSGLRTQLTPTINNLRKSFGLQQIFLPLVFKRHKLSCTSPPVRAHEDVPLAYVTYICLPLALSLWWLTPLNPLVQCSHWCCLQDRLNSTGGCTHRRVKIISIAELNLASLYDCVLCLYYIHTVQLVTCTGSTKSWFSTVADGWFLLLCSNLLQRWMKSVHVLYNWLIL